MPHARLARAVAMIAAQSGASIGTDHPEWLRRPVGPVSLTGRVEVVLERLLKDTGLMAVRTGPASWRIVVRPPVRSSRPAASRKVAKVDVPRDIVVTGSKVGLQLREFPGAVDVIGGERLEQTSANQGTLALAELHATLSSTRLGPGRNKLFLRSIADSSFNGSSPALVGQYFRDLRLTYASPDPDLRLHDIEQVEILEGPQGTLYGAGSLGGILRVVPRAPDPSVLRGSSWAGLSATAHGSTGRDTGVIANVPLASRAALRMVIYAEHDAGFIDDTRRARRNVNKSDVVGLRGALLIKPMPGLQIEVTTIGQHIRNADAQYTQNEGGGLTRASSIDQPSFHDYRSLSASVQYDLAGASLRSTTGYVRQNYGQTFDATQPGDESVSFRQEDRVRLLSNETHLSGRTVLGASWVAGLAALRSQNHETRTLGTAVATGDLGRVRSSATELTAFGEFGVPLSRTWKVTAGGRISTVILRGSSSGPIAKPVGNVPGRGDRNTQWLATPSVSLGWQPDDRLSVYLRYAGSYRPGGLTIGAVVERFRPDRIRTSEIGLRFACGCSIGARIDGSLSSSRWKDVQADLLDGLGLPHVANIGQGRVNTVTASVSIAPSNGIELRASGFASRGNLKSSGETIEGVSQSALPNVARYGLTGSVLKRWDFAGGNVLMVDLRGQAVGPSILGVGPQLAHRQGNYRTVSSGMRLSLDGLAITFRIENLFDTRGNVFALGTPFTISTGRQRTPLQPRTARVGLEMRY